MTTLKKSDPDVIVKTTAQRMLAVVGAIAGSNNRHQKILEGISKKAELTKLRDKRYLNPVEFAEYFSNKLKKDEGVILSHEFIRKIIGTKPTEFVIANLSRYLNTMDLHLVPIYSKVGTENQDDSVSIMTTIHRKHYKAMHYSDQVVDILKGRGASEASNSALVKTAMKIGEELGRTKVPDINTILEVLDYLEKDEVYCISMAYFYGIQVDPQALSKKLEEKGFHVCRLLNSNKQTETAEVYKFYDELFGLLISRTNVGITRAQANLNLMFQICAATEEGLPKPANETPINAGSPYKQ